jgi:hypothetical protein
MTSFITTMLAYPKSPCPTTNPHQQHHLMNSFPTPPRALDSVVTPTESNSCIHLPQLPHSDSGQMHYPQTPRSVYATPIHTAFHAALRSPPPPYPRDNKRGMSENDFEYSNSRTRAPFRPQKAGKGSTNWQLKQFAEATLGSGSLRKAVKLPEGEDKDEWLAVNCTLHCA